MLLQLLGHPVREFTQIVERCARLHAGRAVITEIVRDIARPDDQKAFNRMLSAVLPIVEPPFRVVKRQFGFVKVRYRGLAKNTGQIVTLFALANMWLARKRLLPLLGEVRP